MNRTLESDLRGLNKRLDYYETQLADGKGDTQFNMRQIGYYQGEAAKVREVLLDTISPVEETTAAPAASSQPTKQTGAHVAGTPNTVGGTATTRGATSTPHGATAAQTRPGEVL